VLATYVLGLREGLEVGLIVGIVAAFLRQQGHRNALRSVWMGVAIAVVVCAAMGVALQILNQELPQRQQEMLETVVGLCAVAIVTFMVVWMRRHARGLKADLEAHAAAALATGSVLALVAMAFFAVLREGVETAVFLLAAFPGPRLDPYLRNQLPARSRLGALAGATRQLGGDRRPAGRARGRLRLLRPRARRTEASPAARRVPVRLLTEPRSVGER
jgi:FTR1 family protein